MTTKRPTCLYMLQMFIFMLCFLRRVWLYGLLIRTWQVQMNKIMSTAVPAITSEYIH